MSKFNIQYYNLLLIPLIFLFLPAFYIPLGILVPAYYFFILIIFLPYIIFNYRFFSIFLIKLYKYSPFKYFIWFSLWVILSLLILVFVQKISIAFAVSAIVIVLGGYFILYFLYPAYVIDKNFTIKKIAKFLSLALYITLIWGILTYLGNLLQIKFLQILENFFSNRQLLLRGSLFTLARSRSFLFEPGFYAYFLSLNLPLFFYLNKSKYKIFHNSYLNLIIKKTILPLAILNLILTFSPIGWVFGICITLFCNYKNILNFLTNKKKLIKILLLVSIINIFIFTFYKNLAENVAVKRIFTVVANSAKDIEYLTIVEPSLYTRIVSYTNAFCLFLQHPLLGVGLDQSKFTIISQFEHSPIILSKENRFCLEKANTSGKMIYNRNILCDLLCETGIIGCLLFYLFLFKSFCLLNKIQRYYLGFDRDFINVVKNILLIMLFLSFYEVSVVHIPYHFFIFALSNILVLKKGLRQL